MLGAMAGYDPKDSTCVDAPVPDYAAAMREGVKGLRVGVPKEYRVEGMSKEIEALWQQGIAVAEGCRRHDPRDLSAAHEVRAAGLLHRRACRSLVQPRPLRWRALRPARPRQGRHRYVFANTRAAGFGKEVRRRVLIGTYVLSAGYYDAYYLKAQKVRTLIKRDFDEAWNTVDVVLTPTTPSPAFAFGEKTGDPLAMYLEDIFTVTVNMAGLPGMSVPAGLSSEGTPLGLQFIGKPFDEGTLFRAGKVDRGRRRPLYAAADVVALRIEGALKMDPKRPWECADMSHVRDEIDRIDRELVDLIAERFGYVDRAWQLKLKSAEGAVVPWRIQQVIDKVRLQATEKGVSPDLCEALWRQMIGWFIQYEEENLRKQTEGNGGKGA